MDLKTKRAVASESVLVRELQGESVLLHLDSESYFGLDEVGTGMWHALLRSESLEHAYQALLRDYEVGPEQLREDLVDFVEKLSGAGLLGVRDV